MESAVHSLGIEHGEDGNEALAEVVDIRDFHVRGALFGQIDMTFLSCGFRVPVAKLHTCLRAQACHRFFYLRIFERVVPFYLWFLVDGCQILRHDAKLGQLRPRLDPLTRKHYHRLRLNPLFEGAEPCRRRPVRRVDGSFFFFSDRTIRIEEGVGSATKVFPDFSGLLSLPLFRILHGRVSQGACLGRAPARVKRGLGFASLGEAGLRVVLRNLDGSVAASGGHPVVGGVFVFGAEFSAPVY